MTDDHAEPRRMQRALTEIRREGWKIAAVYAVADAALATLAVNLLVTLGGPSVAAVPARVPVPGAVLDAIRSSVGVTPPATVATAAVAGGAAGLLVFVVEVAVRVRRPLVEQFEAANPDLRESLRTARDAVRSGEETRIARRLYEDVLADLSEASSAGLVDLRRVSGTVLLVALLSVGTIHLAVVDISLAGGGGSVEGGEPAGGTQSDYTGLQDGSSILGEPEDVPSGEEELDATVDTSGSGSGDGADAESAASYDRSGYEGAGAVQSQRAEFTERERLEDADLIREYNLRIREDQDEDT
jgi:hypothetical protein